MRKSTPPPLQLQLKKITVWTVHNAAVKCCRKSDVTVKFDCNMNVLNVSEEATQNSDEQNNEVAWLGLTTSEEDNASLENDYEDIVQETM